MYFCIHNCTSASNDYKAVACSNNNQAQLHAHVSVAYWSPDVCLGLELLRDIQFGLPAILKLSTKILLCVSWMDLCDRKWAWQPKIFSGWTLLSEFLNPPLIHPEQTQPSWCTTLAKWIVHDWPDVLYSELCPPPPTPHILIQWTFVWSMWTRAWGHSETMPRWVFFCAVAVAVISTFHLWDYLVANFTRC